MAAPTSYTETSLKQFMGRALGAVADVLGWTIHEGDYDEAVNETLLAYGVADIASATDIRKLRTLARREVWRAAMAELSTDYDYSKQGDRSSRSQAFAQAQKMFAMAETDAARYDTDANSVAVETVAYADPYEAREADE